MLIARQIPEKTAMRFLKVLVGGLLGGMVGYYVGAFVACTWLMPTSNLCGLAGAFVTGPIGILAGAVAGWLMARPGRA